MSTAETAQLATPGRPRLRHEFTMRAWASGTFRAPVPTTDSESSPSMTDWHAFDPYVQPVPTTPAAEARATTTVVLFQRRVPSASGWSVGIS